MMEHISASNLQPKCKINDKFKEVFNTNFQYHFRAPARVNLIGEHIDYVGGTVFPCGISLYMDAYVSLRNDEEICLYSEGLNLVKANLKDIKYDKKQDWANYPLGAISILLESGYDISKGLNIYYKSSIPLGSGLSSSAAILVLTSYLVSNIFKLHLSKKKVAIIARKAEVEFNGLNCGIMDQAAIALAKPKKAILLNCDKFTYSYSDVDFGPYSLVLMNTNKARKLNESKYNERVEECAKLLALLKPHFNIHNLCDLKEEDLDKAFSYIDDDILRRRLHHIVKENARTFKFADAMMHQDYKMAGEILNESHYSLSNDYEVAGFHLDAISSSARNFKTCLGSRMTGAGFGGFAIALVLKSDVDEFKEHVKKEYQEKTGITPTFYILDIVNGVRKC